MFNHSNDNNSENFLKNDKKINDNNKPIIFEPLLTYYESEDEYEIKEYKAKKNKIVQ